MQRKHRAGMHGTKMEKQEDIQQQPTLAGKTPMDNGKQQNQFIPYHLIPSAAKAPKTKNTHGSHYGKRRLYHIQTIHIRLSDYLEHEKKAENRQEVGTEKRAFQ